MNKEEIIELPKIFDPRGSLTVAEQNKNIPFLFHKTTWTYGTTPNMQIEGTTNHEQQKLFVALSGSFSITIKDGNTKRTYMLNHPYQGLWIKPLTTYHICDFSNGSVCLEISSK